MKKKKLILKKEVIANLSNKEMSELEGGTGSDWFCKTTGGGVSCNNYTCIPPTPIPVPTPKPVPTPEPSAYWSCEVCLETDHPCW